jgi:hypothetical protein
VNRCPWWTSGIPGGHSIGPLTCWCWPGGWGLGGGEEGSPLTGGLDQQTGFVVDEVLGVLGRAELPAAGDGPPRALPAYVVDVLRLDGGPLFVVDIGRMVTALADRSDRPDQGQT